jgi:hypothetical protein
MLQDGVCYSKHISLTECEERNERLDYLEEIFLLKHLLLYLQVLQQHHNTPELDPCGQSKTFEIIALKYI